MKLTKAVWNKYSKENVLKFCIDILQNKIFFHDFDIDHFVFAVSIIGRKRPRTRDELFDILDNLQNKIVGGNLIKDKDKFVCLLGISGIEYELKSAHKEHNSRAVDLAADVCVAEFSRDSFFRPLVVNKHIGDKTVQHIFIN